jgi:chromosome segregation ATPase
MIDVLKDDMIVVLLPAVLVVGVVTLAVAVRNLLITRRSEELGEGRYELLRDQHDRLELLREERRMLVDELKRESQERQQFAALLGKASPQLVEDLKQVREGSVENARRSEERERERLQQERLQLEEELRRLDGELEQERQKRSEVQRQAEQLEQERLRLEHELDRSKDEPGGGRSEVRQWWRRPVLVIGLLVGALAAWFTSLVMALNLLSP